jgi:hypothetical protein
VAAQGGVSAGDLPELTFRDLPEPVSLRKMLGPSLILAGLALGSGEFVFWPYLTFHSGYVFFWACLIGVATQYFLNMEITRWTLATGESAITGFCRLSRHWAWIFLLLNIVPWMIPAWSRGTGKLAWWLIDDLRGGIPPGGIPSESWLETAIGIAGLLLCGAILTAGPVIYETVERIQMFLVTLIMVVVVTLAVFIVRWDAVTAMLAGAVSFGELPPIGGASGLSATQLLGALAFAGAGGTLNLGQSNYVKDKGFGMGAYVGRITSLITGKAEETPEIGYQFPDTPENRRRWKIWWRNAGIEHFLNFFATCVICLVLLTLISYSVFYDADTGRRVADAEQYGRDMNFIWGEANEIDLRFGASLGSAAKVLFLLMGVAILLTTEFGVLDVTARISADIVKVNWLREKAAFGESRLYYLFLWGMILLGVVILGVVSGEAEKGFFLFQLTAAMNGGVMFLYSGTLLYMNLFKLPATTRMSWWRALILVWSFLFFGFFTCWALWDTVGKKLLG